MLKDIINDNLQIALNKLGIKNKTEVEAPSNNKFGDYSTSVAMQIAKKLKKNPLTIAQEIINNIPTDENIEKIEILKPGFINFKVSTNYLLELLPSIIKQENNYGKSDYYKDKKVMVEYTDPNPFKEFHIGHLYSNTVGESLARIYEFFEAEVKRANYEGDVGMHVAKSIYGMKKKIAEEKITLEDLDKKTLDEKAKFMGQAYAQGAKIFEENEEEKKQIVVMNKKIYSLDPEVKEFYEKGRKWTLEYFETIYKRLGTKFDYYYFEKEIGKIGIKYVIENLTKSVFEKSQGAIIFPGKKYGLHTRVFVNSYGLPTYEAKDLGLAPAKYNDFPYDLSIIVTGSEINEYFKVVLKALEIINPELRKKTQHISHGMVRLPKGKMSSRTGNVITGVWLIEETKKNVLEIIKNSDKISENEKDVVAEAVTIGAIKYSLLKTNIGGDVVFNFKDSLSLQGNSGPYLQYAYSRCKSILKKVNNNLVIKQFNNVLTEPEELDLLRAFVKFPEVVLEAGKNYAPNYICNYLFDLAQKFNLFYQKHSVLQAEENKKQFRLKLTNATANILKNGLYLLGIKTVEKM